MIKNKNLNSKIRAQQKIILLCFVTLVSAIHSLGQIRFIKPIAQPEYNLEFSYHPAEIKNFYFIPIFTNSLVSEPYRFSILKLDKSGSIVDRLYFDDGVNERGSLYNAGDEIFWKYSVGFDSLYFSSFKLFDSEFRVLKNIKVPCAIRKGIPTGNTLYYQKLSNGDFIFMLDVEIGFSGSYIVNYIYITKEGELKVNKAIPSISLGNYVINSYNENMLWQLNDTSIITIASENKCLMNCITVRKMNLIGNEFFSKKISNISLRTFKKCGDRFYGLRKRPSNGKDTLVCFNENFDVMYLKEIPDSFGVYQFWDNNDNSDFTIRGGYANSTDYYETIIDTSFTWKKAKLFSYADSKLNYINGEIRFWATSDGGALYLCDRYKELNYDLQVVLIKYDTGSYCYNDNCKNLKENVTYPNPNNGDKLYFTNDSWETVSIYDNVGRLIFFYENQPFNILNNINVESLQPGNYYLRIKFPDKTVNSKLIKY